MFGIDDLAVAAMAGSVLDTASGIFNNERNIHFAEQNLAWQKQVQNTTWQREDNAVQRRAADLKAAGFNPLLAAGGAASSGQAVATTAPQSNMKTNFAETAIALARAQNDISMTRSQQELLKQQADVARQNADLLRLQKEWYQNHPDYAPGVESGLHTGKGVTQAFDNVSNRVASWFTGKPQRANPNFDKIVDYHMSNGVPAGEAVRRANKMLANYK